MRVQKTIAEFLADGEREIPIVAAADDVGRAVAVIRDARGDCALVVDDDRRLVGIFTERDFLNRVAAAGRSVGATRISEVMTPDPETLRAEDRVAYAINRMAVGGYRNVPVVDRDGRPVANLGVRDIIALLREVFDELDAEPAGGEWDEWTDIGGG